MTLAQFLKVCGWSQARIDEHLKAQEEWRLHCQRIDKEREGVRAVAIARGACVDCALYTWRRYGEPKYIRHRKNCPRKGRALR